MKKNYIKIVLDILMAITFVLLMNPRVLNGLPFHEIAGLVIGVAVLVHIGLNYRWVINTTRKIFDTKLPKKTRISYLLNILLLISMAVVIISGILISRVVFPNLAIQGNHSIRGIHSLSADTTLAIVGLHLALHWQWIMNIFKRAFKSKEGKLRTGVIASVILSLAILAGGIQWFSSSASTSSGNFNPKQMQQSAGGPSFNNGNTSTANNAQANIQGNNSNFQGPPNGDFHGHDGGDRAGSSPFLVILNYFAIWAAIIIPAYYLEKRIFRHKHKSKDIQAQKI